MIEKNFNGVDFEELKKIKRIKAVEKLLPFIKKAEEEGYKVKDIINFLNEKGLNINENTYYAYMTKLNKQKKELEMKQKKSKKIALVNFKGGVGKSTIANLLDYEGSIVVNIDMQNASEINAGDRTVDYFADKEEFEVSSIKEMLNVLEESGVELIFIDTPGAVTDELLEIFPELDYVVIVTNPNTRDISQTLNTLVELQDSDAKIILLHNKWYKDEDLEQLKELENTAKELFKDKYIGSTNLKYSRAIPTIDRTKKNIMQLNAINKVAYTTAKKNILKMKEDIKKLIDTDS